ncbi:uncharacterized protein LOC143831866 [Paroedura picta]|uniref:uncharacterized protein LOC143831866 n=1 Tax=Paroedura picta TaxID=143630 RepID=UPI004055AA01
MEEGQTIASAIKNPKKEETRRKKKRLTFVDEIHDSGSDEQARVQEIAELFATKGTNFLTFGLNLVKRFYQQALDIAGVTFNSRKGKLVLADGRGLSTLDLFSSNSAAQREMIFPRYQFNLVRIVTFSEKYNVYFILARDYAIKVYNKNYNEICSVVNPDSRRLTFITFNPVTDEVICGGTKGVQLWKFKEKRFPDYSNAIPMINYSLFFSAEYPYMGKKWCTNMEFDVNMQRFYCFSDCHIFCYDISGNWLFEIPHAHQSAVVCCIYSSCANILLTASRGTEIKAWNDQACLVHVFQGHTKAVTKLLLHPSNTSLFISGSLDGSIKLWSLDSMQLFYSLSIFQEGILWIGTVHDNWLYCSSARTIHLYDLNSFTSFWAHINGRINNLQISRAGGKSSRVIAMGIDNSLRIFSLHGGTKLCTILPPPFPSGLQPVLSFTYNRNSGTVYLLLTPWDIWVYTARTDPACRAAVWTTEELQQHLHRKHPLASCVQKNEYFQHTRKRNFRTSVRCECLCSLSSPLCNTTDEGLVFADNQEFLVLGMQDGRILFLHTSIKNLVYYEMIAYKDPVIHLRHDVAHQQLVIMCQRPTCKLIHFRSLPALDLVYHIEASNDTTVFTRIERTLLAGLKSGALEFFDILTDDDQRERSEKGVINTRKNYRKNDAYCSENFHKGPVVAVDSCNNLLTFLSCGSDSMIKLWDSQKNMLAEITLDSTLSTACFLNSSGNILLAFKNDIYILPLSKALGLSEADIDSSSLTATESFIFESQPSDEQEAGSKIDVSKSFEMNSYLVPYRGFTFSEDFTSELLFLPKKKGKPNSRLPVAPSEIYCSPCDSETSLKLFDFLLRPRTHNLEEQDKAEISKRMIITKDMKYVPGPKPARPAHLEMPIFGVSPCSSLIQQQPETKSKEQLVKVAGIESELSIMESLQEDTSEQQQVNEEKVSEVLEISSEAENEVSLDKKETSELLLHTDSFLSEQGTETATKTSTLFSRNKKHIPKKSPRREVLQNLRIPKHARLVAKGVMRSREHTYSCASHKLSSISVGKKQSPTLRTKNLAPTEERSTLTRKTSPPKEKDDESPYEKNIKRAASWRRKENERIQQAEERHSALSRAKSLCSRNRCGFTPNNSQQYPSVQTSEYLPEFDYTSWMKPDKRFYIRPYTVMEETTINLPRDFPYRLAWGTSSTPDLDIKLYPSRMKFNKEGKSDISPIEKNLQPTQSIPTKGRFILAYDPNSPTPIPAPTRLESKLLGVRFPRLKDKIFQSLLSEMQESC